MPELFKSGQCWKHVQFHLIQDGAPAHMAEMTQKWCREILTGFGRG